MSLSTITRMLGVCGVASSSSSLLVTYTRILYNRPRKPDTAFLFFASPLSFILRLCCTSSVLVTVAVWRTSSTLNTLLLLTRDVSYSQDMFSYSVIVFFFLSCVALISFLFLDALDEENRFPYILIPLGPGVSWTCCQFVSCSRPILSSTFVLPLIYESRFLFSLFLSLAPLSKLSL